MVEIRWCPIADVTQMGLARAPILGDMEYGFLRLKGESRQPCVHCDVCRGCTYPCRLVKSMRDLEHPRAHRIATTWSGKPVPLCEHSCACKLSSAALKAAAAVDAQQQPGPLHHGDDGVAHGDQAVSSLTLDAVRRMTDSSNT